MNSTSNRYGNADEACTEIQRLPGIGPKLPIASCCLPGFPEAFPVDTWIIKALHQLTFRRAPKPKPLQALSKHFAPHHGYAQQCLFHHVHAEA